MPEKKWTRNNDEIFVCMIWERCGDCILFSIFSIEVINLNLHNFTSCEMVINWQSSAVFLFCKHSTVFAIWSQAFIWTQFDIMFDVCCIRLKIENHNWNVLLWFNDNTQLCGKTFQSKKKTEENVKWAWNCESFFVIQNPNVCFMYCIHIDFFRFTKWLSLLRSANQILVTKLNDAPNILTIETDETMKSEEGTAQNENTFTSNNHIEIPLI